MAKRPLVEFTLQVINVIFTLWGLGTLGYGLFCFFKWKQNPSEEIHESNVKYMIGHRLLLAIESSKPSTDFLPNKVWFIYLLIAIGAVLFIISCCGYVGTASRSPCCLISYCVFLVALVIVEIVGAVFILLKHNWKDVIPRDRSGNFQSVYHFLNEHWVVIRWVALGVFILQVIAMILALYLQSVFKRGWYDRSDDDERAVYLPRVRTNYRQLVPISGTPLATSDTTNRRDPTKITVKLK